MTAVPPTVVVADDHAPMREATIEILVGGGFDVVGAAPDGPGAVALAKALRPDICVLDVSMPGGGIEAARAIAEALPDTSVVMLTVLLDDDTLFDALRAGACGYLVKGTAPATMLAALGDVLTGEPALSPGLAMRILEHLGPNDTRRVHVPDRGVVRLSRREAEVLDLLRQGLRTSDIARRLFISQATVRTHVAGIVKKLNVTSRDEAVQLLDG